LLQTQVLTICSTSIALKHYDIQRICLLCVDKHARQCHSIIAELMINYKKQVLITEIKNEQ